ncbi:lactate utilization protein C [Thermobifida halotolerans]|uniref:Lactate utilization protein C n=1 Tax=Thermobifida halotolerans TaxID=483545 RepID=A0AA97M2Z9_9ACTN|nr:lactate utilization protein C [Thermobifida halotolerans]UOE18629.1 lactate utilization protein C [Thermobifida halotolerans]
MSGSRERILARVRAALADVPRDEEPAEVAVPPGRAATDLVDLFVDRLEHYRARPHRVRAADLPEAVAAALRRRGAGRVVAPADLPGTWTERAETAVVADGGLDLAALDAVDGVITGCAVAVAETGTIVLDGGAAQGRRALTLVPDYHLCVVHADQIVPDVPDAVARLSPTRPLTWISGPSATSDIELDRVEGVHGPRTLEVLVVSP